MASRSGDCKKVFPTSMPLMHAILTAKLKDKLENICRFHHYLRCIVETNITLPKDFTIIRYPMRS